MMSIHPTLKDLSIQSILDITDSLKREIHDNKDKDWFRPRLESELYQIILGLQHKLESLSDTDFEKELEFAVKKYGKPERGVIPPIPELNPFCAYEKEVIRRGMSPTTLLPEDSEFRCKKKEGGRKKRRTRRRHKGFMSRRRR